MAEGSPFTQAEVDDGKAPVRVLFEVTKLQPGPQTGRSGEIARSYDGGSPQSGPAEIAMARLEEIGRRIKEVAATVMTSLKPLEAKRTVVEFGVEIAADTGGITALIVKGSGKANLKITAEW
ncbi:MAG: CU044_2847 family protein [Terracidiphilus sp.]|jgi:hypothetical protein